MCQRAQKIGMQVVAFDASNLDISDPRQIKRQLQSHRPDYVVNCASYSVVDLAEANPDEAYRVNKTGAESLAHVCAQLDIPLLHLSTDYVFNSEVHQPIPEQYTLNPVNVFGHSKAAGEAAITSIWHKHIILRVGWIFSSRGNNFVLRTLNQIRSQKEVVAVDDQWGCPTDAFDVARVLLAIIQQVDCGINVWGLYHYSGAEIVTWRGFADAILAAVKPLPDTLATQIIPVTSSGWQAKAPRPVYTVLDCQHILATFGIRQRPWRAGLVKVINNLGNADVIQTGHVQAAAGASAASRSDMMVD